MKGKKKWRLSKTLSRSLVVRQIDDADVKFAWAAYKKDGLSGIDFPKDLTPILFKEQFENFVNSKANMAWTVVADGKPIGFALGQWVQAFMFITGIAWFPWASPRNIVEGTICLFNSIRKQFAVMGMANDEHRPLYEACCMHGIMRRIGKSDSVGRMTLFEVRQ